MRSLRLSLLALLFFSCTTPGAIEQSKQYERGRETEGLYFFIKPDGQKVSASKIARPSVGNHTQDRIVVDGQKMDAPDQVIAYQDATGYYKFRKDPKPTRYWKGEFIKRMRAGQKMGLYIKTFYSGGHEEHFYFDKNDGPLTLLTYESFSAALADRPELKLEFERLYPKRKIMVNRQFDENNTNLPRLVELYNQ